MTTSLSLRVNGKDVVRDIEPNTLLVTFVREHLRLTARTSAATPRSAAPAPSISTATR